MAQKHPVAIVAWKILLRIVLFCMMVYLAAYESVFALNILWNYLGYVTPEGFFGFTFTDDFVSVELPLVLFGSIFFGVLGKKIDYILIFLILLQALWEYNSTSTVTYGMFWGLVGAAIIGNVIGLILKLLRQRFLPKLVV